MAMLPALRNALWPKVDAEQRIADFHAEVDRLARERGLQDDPFARLALSLEVGERLILESGDRLARRWNWAVVIILMGIALWTAIVLAFG